MKIKPFYTYYAAHVLRQYFSRVTPSAPTRAWILNNEAVDRAVSALNDEDKRLFSVIYARSGSVSENVSIAAARFDMDPEKIWVRVAELERAVAKEREII